MSFCSLFESLVLAFMEELPLDGVERVTFFAGAKKVTKENTFLNLSAPRLDAFS
jgi:hypothetical protein